MKVLLRQSQNQIICKNVESCKQHFTRSERRSIVLQKEVEKVKNDVVLDKFKFPQYKCLLLATHEVSGSSLVYCTSISIRYLVCAFRIHTNSL